MDMSNIDNIVKEHGALLAAIEDLHSFQASLKSFSGVGVGLESMPSCSHSMTAALEEETSEKKKGVFARLIDFFRNLYKRIKEWFKQRAEAKKATDELKAVMAENKKSSKQNPKAQAALAKEFEASLAKTRDEAIRLLDSPEFLQKEFVGLSKEYGALSLIATSSGDGQKILELMTRTSTNLDQAMKYHRNAVQAARQGQGQAAPQAQRMNEIIGSASQSARELATHANMLGNSQAKSLNDIFATVTNDRFIDVYLKHADTSDFERALEDMESDLAPFLRVFEEIAESDPDDLSDQARKIYEIDPANLMILVQAPAHFLGIIGRMNTATSQITPNTFIDVKKIAARAVRTAFNGVDQPQIFEHAVAMVEQSINSKL